MPDSDTCRASAASGIPPRGAVTRLDGGRLGEDRLGQGRLSGASLEPDLKVVERYQGDVIQPSLLQEMEDQMPWDAIARRQHNRGHLLYPSDLTDREWSIMEPFIPPAKSGGRPRTTDMREIVNAILYIGGSGCQWRSLPRDFTPGLDGARLFP